MVDFPDSPAPVRESDRGRVLTSTTLTQQQHLDLIALGQLVTLQLILDLIVTCLAGIIFLARTTPHCDGLKVIWIRS
jgi:hypothetical protein